MDRPLRVAALAASNRRGSLNRSLLARITSEMVARGAAVDVIDLRDHVLPIYDADLQESEGIPAAAVALHQRFAAADAIVFAVPEYNGGYPALFKNVIDWVSRVDMFTFLPRYVGVVATTPGKGGGSRGIEHVRALLHNMFVTTHDGFALPKGNEVLGSDALDDETSQALHEWVDGFLDAADEHASKQAASVA